MSESIRIPLFPLGLVLLPGMTLPLHIFEERYKQMIGECLAEDRPFGIVLFDGGAIRRVGCLARVTEVLERYDDGRLDILTRGGERFLIRELLEEKAYMEAQVLLFDDEDEAEAAGSLPDLMARAWGHLEGMVDLDLGFDPADPGGAAQARQLAFAVGALEGFTPAERQTLLEMTSTAERLTKCLQALAAIAARHRLTREIKRLIGGNGHPPRKILRELADRLK